MTRMSNKFSFLFLIVKIQNRKTEEISSVEKWKHLSYDLDENDNKQGSSFLS